MALTLEDRILIHELIALHGHLVDHGQLDRLDEVFTADARMDLTAVGGGVLRGVAEARRAAEALGDRNPVAHHVTNTVVGEKDGRVGARSKYLGVRTDGSVGSGTYEDVLERTAKGWRITGRRITPRRVPLQP